MELVGIYVFKSNSVTDGRFFKKKLFSWLYYLTSSIFNSLYPSNCMMILCSWVPWRKTSTLGAAA